MNIITKNLMFCVLIMSINDYLYNIFLNYKGVRLIALEGGGDSVRTGRLTSV